MGLSYLSVWEAKEPERGVENGAPERLCSTCFQTELRLSRLGRPRACGSSHPCDEVVLWLAWWPVPQ